MIQIPRSCPFCGLLCDDFEQAGALPASFCTRAARAHPVVDTGEARLRGKKCSPEEAIRAAAGILAAARRPLVGGLACDVAGQRAALDLAERAGGVVDHMNGDAMFRNWLAMQEGGWIVTTLSEVRNRADMVVFLGAGPERFPRFASRCLMPEGLFGTLVRRVVTLAPAGTDATPPEIAIAPKDIGTLVAAMRARLAGQRLDARSVAGMQMDRVDALLDEMRAAKYGVLAWDAAAFDFEGADMTVRAIADLINDLNRTTRWSGLPLGGNDGDASAAQVCTWRTGYPSRVAFEAAGPRYDPIRFATHAMLARKEVDAVVWISAFDSARIPPQADCPVVVLGRPDMHFALEPDVFLPVAVPGIHSGGMLHRMDGVVVLPLRARAASSLATAADTLAAIMEEMRHA